MKTTNKMSDKLQELYNYLVEKTAIKSVDTAIVLGSGLGGFAQELSEVTEIAYESIPNFPKSTVSGHKGSLLFGKIENKLVLCFSGRFHFYEGHDAKKTQLPIQLAHVFKAKKLVVTNAAGGINETFKPSDIMAIRSVMNPLGKGKVLGLPKFSANNCNQFEQLLAKAEALSIPIKSGNYLYVTGPNYETAAEIHAFRKMGGDAVGMSTFAELMEAERLELPYFAFSLISNMAAGMTAGRLDHTEIKEMADRRIKEVNKLVKAIIALN